ncbi:MAG: hypothetical protein LAO20_16045 [Acidobacteriia bacterium]|nr:hypothetical protein [Terriglobia bacterium]
MPCALLDPLLFLGALRPCIAPLLRVLLLVVLALLLLLRARLIVLAWLLLSALLLLVTVLLLLLRALWLLLLLGARLFRVPPLLRLLGVPLYSANAIQPMGYVEKSNISDFSCPVILWGIDNSLFNYNLIPAGQVFATTDHCGAIQILDKSIVPEYVLYALCLLRSEESFDRSFRSSLTNMRLLSLAIPVKQHSNGFDITAQRAVAKRFTTIQETQQRLSIVKRRLDDVFSRYLVLGNWH